MESPFAAVKVCGYHCRALSWEGNKEKLAVDGKPHCLLETYPKPVIKKRRVEGSCYYSGDGPHSDSHSLLCSAPLQDRGSIYSSHYILSLFQRKMDFKIQQDMVRPSSQITILPLFLILYKGLSFLSFLTSEMNTMILYALQQCHVVRIN